MKIARRAAAIGALLGLLVPLLSLSGFFLFHLEEGSLFWVWPSALQLMVLENRPPWFVVIIVYSESIGINVLLYAGVAWSGGFIYDRVFKGAVE